MGPRVKRKTINRNFCKPAQISGSRCRNETFVAQSTRPEAISHQLQILSSATIFRWIAAAHECFHLGEEDSTFRNGDKSDRCGRLPPYMTNIDAPLSHPCSCHVS